MRKKIAAVFGTRPEAVKMAPLISCLKEQRDIQTKVILSGQHRQMLDQVIELFEIPIDYDLDIMTESQPLNRIIEKVISGLDIIYEKEKPDIVLVHGDTTTTLAAALAAYYRKIRVGHVEAGLRSGDPDNPFPEEYNRRITDVITTYHFAPTNENKNNLIAENIYPGNIFVTGNTVIDSLQKVSAKELYPADKRIRDLEGSRYILLTAHRRENLGRPMKEVFRAVKKIGSLYPDIRIVYPVHLNPEINSIARSEFKDSRQFMLIAPVSYADMIFLIKNCFFCITDSGGIQEEAPSLSKPVLVIRNTTERPEAVKAGTVKVIGTDKDDVIYNCTELIENKSIYSKMAAAKNPYGDGSASKRIVSFIEYIAGIRKRKPRQWMT